MIDLHRNGESLSIITDEADAKTFTNKMASLLVDLQKKTPAEDQQELLQGLLSQYVEICLKYRGYKSTVTERRLLISGPPGPSTVIASVGRREQSTKDTPGTKEYSMHEALVISWLERLPGQSVKYEEIAEKSRNGHVAGVRTGDIVDALTSLAQTGDLTEVSKDGFSPSEWKMVKAND